MTGLLNDLMHERADSLPAPGLDLASITRAGERRARTRRTAWAGGLAASVLAAAALGNGVVSRDRTGGAGTPAAGGVAGAAASPAAPSWVVGQNLHQLGAASVDLGSPVRAWVWAGEAVAFVDTAGRVQVWDDGTSTVVGRAAVSDDERHPDIVADGSRIAWVDPEGGFTLRDLETGEVAHTPVQGDEAWVSTLDGDVVHAVDARGALVLHPWTREVEVLDADPTRAALDVEGDTHVRGAGASAVHVSGPGRDTTITVPTQAGVDLSPDGALVLAMGTGSATVVDTATGERIRMEHAYTRAVPFHWLDNDTFAVAASREDALDGTVYVLRCSVRERDCATTSPGFFGWGFFKMPTGIFIDPRNHQHGW